MRATIERKITIEDVDVAALKLACSYANLWMQEMDALPCEENTRVLEFLYSVHELTECESCEGKGVTRKKCKQKGD